MADLAPLIRNIEASSLARAERAAAAVVAQTSAAASRRTGALAESISASAPSLANGRIVITIIAAAPHARYQDEGTGIYGPRRTRIFPKTAKVLRFDWPAAGGVVFARSVAGAPGTHFFYKPMPQRWHDALVAA